MVVGLTMVALASAVANPSLHVRLFSVFPGTSTLTDPELPLFRRDCEQRKSLAGIATSPAPHMVHLQSQSGGRDKVTHRYGQNLLERVNLSSYRSFRGALLVQLSSRKRLLLAHLRREANMELFDI